MFKDIRCFVTFFISGIIMLATCLILFRLTPPLVFYGGEIGDYLLLQQLPHFFLPVTSLILSLLFLERLENPIKNCPRRCLS